MTSLNELEEELSRILSENKEMEEQIETLTRL